MHFNIPLLIVFTTFHATCFRRYSCHLWGEIKIINFCGVMEVHLATVRFL